jgi:hypothetical protein
VLIFKELSICQEPYTELFTKLPVMKADTPGAKTPQNCPWWVHFRPDQGQKPRKTAPGVNLQRIVNLPRALYRAFYKVARYEGRYTRGKNPANLPLVGMFQA